MRTSDLRNSHSGPGSRTSYEAHTDLPLTSLSYEATMVDNRHDELSYEARVALEAHREEGHSVEARSSASLRPNDGHDMRSHARTSLRCSSVPVENQTSFHHELAQLGRLVAEFASSADRLAAEHEVQLREMRDQNKHLEKKLTQMQFASQSASAGANRHASVNRGSATSCHEEPALQGSMDASGSSPISAKLKSLFGSFRASGDWQCPKDISEGLDAEACAASDRTIEQTANGNAGDTPSTSTAVAAPAPPPPLPHVIPCPVVVPHPPLPNAIALEATPTDGCEDDESSEDDDCAETSCVVQHVQFRVTPQAAPEDSTMVLAESNSPPPSAPLPEESQLLALPADEPVRRTTSAPPESSPSMLNLAPLTLKSLKTVGFGPSDDKESPGGVRFALSSTKDGKAGAGAGGDGPFAMHPSWFESGYSLDKGKFSQNGLSADASTFFEDDEEDESDEDDGAYHSSRSESKKAMRQKVRRILSRFIIHPSNFWRLIWDMAAAALVAYECVIIPLMFFDLQSVSLLQYMTWIVRIFWSFDMPLSLVTGYILVDGKSVLEPFCVIKHYLRTWFIIDASMLVVDWLEVFMGGVGGLKQARLGKTLKSIRMIRMLRLWKVVQGNGTPEVLRAFVEHYFQSEVGAIVMGVLKIVLAVVWVNHVMGCIWYGVGSSAPAESGTTWVLEHFRESDPTAYRYVTAFHWSLSQFTGTMEVMAYNLSERTYAVLMLLFAFVVGAIVVSSITSSMTRLQIARSQEANRIQALKQYLVDNQISSRVAVRVQRNATWAMAEQKRNTPESNIELLVLISEPLRIELHFEVDMPILGYHPFLKNFAEVCPAMMRQICHTATVRLSLSRGDVLFCQGESSHMPQMYFVSNGRLTYTSQHSLMKKKIVHPQDWACEAVLWTPWSHCGAMRAKDECLLLALRGDTFRKTATQFQMQLDYAQKYGAAFIKHLNQTPQTSLTDLEDPEMAVDWLAQHSKTTARDTLRDTFRRRSFLSSGKPASSSPKPRQSLWPGQKLNLFAAKGDKEKSIPIMKRMGSLFQRRSRTSACSQSGTFSEYHDVTSSKSPGS